jgi:hypothetical protein
MLAQTGALSDAPGQNDDGKHRRNPSACVTGMEGQLEAARAEARDLNRRRIDLDRVERRSRNRTNCWTKPAARWR